LCADKEGESDGSLKGKVAQVTAKSDELDLTVGPDIPGYHSVLLAGKQLPTFSE
jgi:hypothetical protein